MIRYAQPLLDDEDIEAVTAVLRTPNLTQAGQVPQFERRVAEYCGAAEAIAVNSATSGLHLACLALDLRAGDRFWTTPITFVATANAARHCGALVEFVDIDPRTRNLCVGRLAEKLEAAARTGTLPAIVAPVHFAGRPCDMQEVARLSRRYGFRVLEDAAHALGARLADGSRVGAGLHSDAAVFSFHAIKVATSGEGGVVTTRDSGIAERLRRLRSHGIVRGDAMPEGLSEGPWSYAQTELGFNFRMTEFQAALGASQVKRIHSFIARRRELAMRYDRLLADLPVLRPAMAADDGQAWHLYVVEVEAARRRAVFERLRDEDIEASVHYLPVYRHPLHRDAAQRCDAADRYYAGALTLPLHVALTDTEQDRVVASLRAALS